MDCIFEKLINEYKEKTKGIDSGYPYGPFFPVVFSGYEDASVRIFYYGRDTYYWLGSDMLDADYLEQNSKVISPDIMLTWNNNTGAFWNIVVKLHLYIRTGKLVEDVKSITLDDKLLLDEIGYGNLHAIETRKTLVNEGTWNLIKPARYNELVLKSRFLDRLQYVLDAYNPHFIVIFCWEDYMDIFNGLEYTCLQEFYEEGFMSVYTIKGYRTKIVWTSHPHRFSFLGTSAKYMIPYLAETIQKLSTIKLNSNDHSEK